ncbi:MAG TPA: glycine cleavage system protein GcvH [Tepidisphaeraceae bacterium]|jgi:glycine cleavage system H protein|nr:glycine cleavage system protein GcvH [Tepidisphaeraceae bacterium]
MSSTPPAQYRYLASHEWHDLQGATVTIGITQIAAEELTDITYVGLPKIGAAVRANQRFGDIESVKATSDLYSGVTGTVTEVNAELAKNPGLVNSDPYKAGWMIKVKVDNPAEVQNLLSLDDYLKKTGHG